MCNLEIPPVCISRRKLGILLTIETKASFLNGQKPEFENDINGQY